MILDVDWSAVFEPESHDRGLFRLGLLDAGMGFEPGHDLGRASRLESVERFLA